MRCAVSRASSRTVSDSEPVKALHEPAEARRLHAALERIRRSLAVRPEQVPALLPEQLADALGVALQVEPARGEKCRGDPAERRSQEQVEVLGARDAEVD